ncbi:MAG: hypothetical protein HY043_22425 [Verrucomicrobia bacterium]|nr:hypothetical protein [Verrucomicrobiota bacterium]
MTTVSQPNIQTNRYPLPSSLANWFDKPTLVRLALEAVNETEPQVSGGPGQASAAVSGSEFREWLTLLTYCYATAIYGSQQIEFEATRDGCIRYLGGNHELDANFIRHFRRAHRKRLHQSLTRLLTRAWERRAAGGWSLIPTEEADAYLLASLNLKTKIESAERFALDAAQRIGAAIQADSMALDD